MQGWARSRTEMGCNKNRIEEEEVVRISRTIQKGLNDPDNQLL